MQEKTPGIIREIERIMEDDTGGDPVKGCKWTHKTTAKVAESLKPAGINVSANTVARLLKQMDYCLRVNLKSLEPGLSKPPDPVERDAQFPSRSSIFSNSGEYIPPLLSWTETTLQLLRQH